MFGALKKGERREKWRYLLSVFFTVEKGAESSIKVI
jgi:hypothetical protein